MNFSFASSLFSFSFKAFGACLSPKRALFSLYTMFSLPLITKLSGCVTYTSFFRSPCRNAALTSRWCISQPLEAARAMMNLTVSMRATGANTYSKSIMCLCMYHFATNLDLCLFILPSEFLLILKIHFRPMAFDP